MQTTSANRTFISRSLSNAETLGEAGNCFHHLMWTILFLSVETAAFCFLSVKQGKAVDVDRSHSKCVVLNKSSRLG